MAPLGTFEELFARPPDGRAAAPARVTLIGDATSHRGGWELSCALPRETVVEVAHRDDDVVEVASTSAPDGHARLNFRIGDESPSGVWLDYVMGVTTALRAEGLPVPGMSLRIDGDVPPSIGSTPGASLVVAVLRAVRTLTGAPRDDVGLARLAYVAEHDFVGAPFAIGAAMASSVGGEDDVVLLDTWTLAFERIPLPANAALVVIDAGVQDVDDLRARRAECALAAQQVGVASLRDLGVADLGRLDGLPDPLRRRARHVVTENARVLAAAEALRRGDRATLGRLLRESHQSLRDDHQVSSFAFDALVECAEDQPGCHAARLSRTGSGGSVVALVDPGAAVSVARAVVEAATRAGATGARVLLPPSVAA